MPELYIGLMSGTSLDAIDAVIVDLEKAEPRLLSHLAYPLTAPLQKEILALNTPASSNELDRSCQLDRELGISFATAVDTLLKQANIAAQQIKAIGSHGQTIRHQPDLEKPYSLQIGDPNTIAEFTGITAVADFRRRDIAAGGQGAPLVPAFHQALFAHPDKTRAIINIGGMANISYLQGGKNKALQGFDTGPGNCLMDAWIQRHQGLNYDQNGNWASQGQPNQALLTRLLEHPFFQQPPPKSTGRESFHLEWLQQELQALPEIPTADVQATLSELSSLSIANAIQAFAPADEVYLCGGGVHNQILVQRLQQLLPKQIITSTETLGLAPDWVEACAFAWLAKQCLQQQAGNHPAVTGAEGFRILGGIYPA